MLYFHYVRNVDIRTVCFPSCTLPMSDMFDWSFSLRQGSSFDTDSDSEDDALPGQGLDSTVDSRATNNNSNTDLDLASREDSATFKPNPWLIAKLNAASRKENDPAPQKTRLTRGISSPASSPVKIKSRVNHMPSEKIPKPTPPLKATNGAKFRPASLRTPGKLSQKKLPFGSSQPSSLTKSTSRFLTH